MKLKSVGAIVLSIILVFSFSLCAFADAADEIAGESVCKVRDLGEDAKTVVISVDIENNPELTDIGTLYGVTLALYEKQAELDDGTYVLMSKSHIAGELALHVILFRLFDVLGGSSEDSSINEYYNGAKVAEINIDEERLSPEIFDAIGALIIAFGSFSSLSST
ncbi:MAG: hypothetical protein IJZ35_06145 [Clostridia bacterium]|nr:hypothetical protein [Clostridia bacterium]